MARVRTVAILVGLLIAIADPSFAANRSRHPSGAHSQSSAKETRSETTDRYDPSRNPPLDHRRGTSSYPYGPGFNLPYPDHPYGAPDRW